MLAEEEVDLSAQHLHGAILEVKDLHGDKEDAELKLVEVEMKRQEAEAEAERVREELEGDLAEAVQQGQLFEVLLLQRATEIRSLESEQEQQRREQAIVGAELQSTRQRLGQAEEDRRRLQDEVRGSARESRTEARELSLSLAAYARENETLAEELRLALEEKRGVERELKTALASLLELEKEQSVLRFAEVSSRRSPSSCSLVMCSADIACAIPWVRSSERRCSGGWSRRRGGCRTKHCASRYVAHR